MVVTKAALAEVPKVRASVNPKPANQVWACGVLQQWVVLFIRIQDLSFRHRYKWMKEV